MKPDEHSVMTDLPRIDIRDDGGTHIVLTVNGVEIPAELEYRVERDGYDKSIRLTVTLLASSLNCPSPRNWQPPKRAAVAPVNLGG